MLIDNSIWTLRRRRKRELNTLRLYLSRPEFSHLFDTKWYRNKYGKAIKRHVDALQHYVYFGSDLGHDPSTNFNTKWYLEVNKDVAKANINPLLHFVEYGFAEGRSPKPTIVRTRQQIIVSDAIQEATYFKSIGSVLSKIMTALKRHVDEHGGIDTVILLPLFGRGGSEKVATYFSRAIQDNRRNSSVVFIITDMSHIDVDVEVPRHVAIIGLNNLIPQSANFNKMELLRALINMVRPRNIHIINSDLGWQLLQRDGNYMSGAFNVYGSIFCVQRERDSGCVIGYASSYYDTALKYCTAILSDNKQFFEDILASGISTESSPKIRSIYNPVDSSLYSKTYLQMLRPRAHRPRVLWAGRLDKQKRVEILFEVAKGMPFVDFYVFGESVTDGDISIEAGSNIYMEGRFTSPEHIFVERTYDLYMHTAYEEGLPNILLEMGVANLPIIAPNVGGIKELISEQTGYLLSPLPNAQEYIDAINLILSHKSIAAQKSKQLRQLIETRHSWASFEEQVKCIPNYV